MLIAELDKVARNSIETATEASAKIALPPEPLSAEATIFWQGSALPENIFGEVRTPPVSAALLKRLGNFPFWRGEENFAETMSAIYSRASAEGLEAF